MHKRFSSKILLIDDSETVRAITRKVLESAGHLIDEAESGREGIEKVRAGDYDLVLLDIRMAGMDGFEVFKELRSHEETELLPEIIFYSDFKKMELKGLQLGACDFIQKSQVSEHPQEFLARVEAHLKIARLTRKCIDLEKLRMLKAAVMSMDHEIRNPLITIALIFEKIKHCPSCGSWYEKGKQSAQRIVDALERLARIEEPTTTPFIGREILDTSENPKSPEEERG